MREKKPCVGGGGFFKIDRPGVGIVTADEEGVLVLGENGDGDVGDVIADSDISTTTQRRAVFDRINAATASSYPQFLKARYPQVS